MGKKKHGSRKHKKFHIWWFMLAGAIVSWVLVLVLYILMYQAMTTVQVDLGDDPNLFGAIFGSMFGTIGAMTGVAAVYAQWINIMFWLAIILTASTIVLAVLESKKVI